MKYLIDGTMDKIFKREHWTKFISSAVIKQKGSCQKCGVMFKTKTGSKGHNCETYAVVAAEQNDQNDEMQDNSNTPAKSVNFDDQEIRMYIGKEYPSREVVDIVGDEINGDNITSLHRWATENCTDSTMNRTTYSVPVTQEYFDNVLLRKTSGIEEVNTFNPYP